MFGQKRNDPTEKDKTTIRLGGYGFLSLLFIILLLLKAGVIETAAMGWSWWWITSPLWGPDGKEYVMYSTHDMRMVSHDNPVFGPSIHTIHEGVRIAEARRKK